MRTTKNKDYVLTGEGGGGGGGILIANANQGRTENDQKQRLCINW